MKNLFHSPLAWVVLSMGIATTGFVTYQQLGTVTAEQQYRTQGASKGDINQTVAANGTINPVSLVNVGTQVSGSVKKLYVDFNSKVEKGQILLKLDDALLAAQQKQSAASLQSALASLELAKANETRIRNLFAQEYVSRQELDTSIQASKAAAAQVQLMQATVEKDRANLAYSVIRSPVSGVVIDRSVDVGQTVAASLQTPTLFKIAQDLSRMQIDANFAEADIGNIRVGQASRFTVDAFPGRHFKGEVRQIRMNPITQQNVVTYDVVVNVNNPEKLLLPGMTAYVSITVAERKEVLLVANAALRFKPKTDEDQAANKVHKRASATKRDELSGTVYILTKGTLQPVSVTLGITDGRNTEIVSGDLKEGDQVVIGESQTANAAPSGSAMRLRMF